MIALVPHSDVHALWSVPIAVLTVIAALVTIWRWSKMRATGWILVVVMVCLGASMATFDDHGRRLDALEARKDVSEKMMRAFKKGDEFGRMKALTRMMKMVKQKQNFAKRQQLFWAILDQHGLTYVPEYSHATP